MYVSFKKGRELQWKVYYAYKVMINIAKTLYDYLPLMQFTTFLLTLKFPNEVQLNMIFSGQIEVSKASTFTFQESDSLINHDVYIFPYGGKIITFLVLFLYKQNKNYLDDSFQDLSSSSRKRTGMGPLEDCACIRQR